LDLAHREFLWLLAFVPLLLAWVARGNRRRAQQWSTLGQSGRLRSDGAAGWLAAMICLIVALAQPRWGRVPAPPLPPGRELVLLVDTSRSMGAEDAVPNRLGVAVESALNLVSALGRNPGAGDRVAVVAFAGRGVLRCPLTENFGAVVETLRRLQPGDVRPGGTDLGAGLSLALETFGGPGQEQAGGRTIVVFSDGEDHMGTWVAAGDRLRAAGVIVHAVALGDAEHGHPVPAGPAGEALKYQGVPVLSRRSDQPLEAIARTTGGAILPLGLAPADLGDLYLQRIEPIARQRRLELAYHASERAERFGWFVLAALGLGLGLAGRWPGFRFGPVVSPKGRGRLPRWLGLFAILMLSPGAAEPSRDETLADAVAAGRSAYASGQWVEALAAFERAVALDPGAAVPRYNGAASLFQMGRYAEALASYRAARQRTRPGDGLRTKIDYALGNTALALGDVASAIGHYDDCLASATTGADLDAVRRDAAINRQFAEQSGQPKAPHRTPDESSPTPRAPGTNREAGARPDAGSSGAQQQGTDDEAAPGHGSNQRRGPGGAGGGGTSAPSGETPEEQLEAAVQRIREARHRRPPESTPTHTDAGNRKDW
jgi:Ca-activated chloride channel family protein